MTQLILAQALFFMLGNTMISDLIAVFHSLRVRDVSWENVRNHFLNS